MSDQEIRSESGLQSESLSTATVYDVYVYEKDSTDNEAVNKGDIVEENENAIDEEINEEYDGVYQEYWPRYATYSNKPESFTQKFLKKKMLVVLVVCAVGVAVGLSVHFATASVGTLFSMKYTACTLKLNFTHVKKSNLSVQRRQKVT